jgi:hypothetical protein
MTEGPTPGMTTDTPFLPETEVRDLIVRAQAGDR